MSQRKGLCVLGSTGTIGVNTLDVVSRHPNSFKIIALTAAENLELLQKQCIEFQPLFAVMLNEKKAEELHQFLASHGSETTVLSGKEALIQVAEHSNVDFVMAAIVGAAGLLPNLAAAKAGKRVLLANKESLVMSGKLFMDTVHKNNAELLPIDSEHNAIFQSMPANNWNAPTSGVEKVLLTGSGGPFRNRDIETLASVTPKEAVAHPNWVMGHKISVDSATMMNKGLEVIEACWLFDIPEEKIQVVIHPESTIHSMVSYNDGSVIAQMGNPDMRTPIAYAMAYPDRIESGVSQLDIFEVSQLNFERPDLDRYPCLRLAFEAHRMGGNATIALNAANEIAVDCFLKNKIKFTDIPLIIENALEQSVSGTSNQISDILARDLTSRDNAYSFIETL